MARILFLGAPVTSPSAEMNTKEKFDATGKNTGNLLIGHALRHELVVDTFEFGTGHDPAVVDQMYDLIAIPAANFIYKHFDFGYLADFIAKTHLPCLMVGVGAQSNSLTDLEIEIPEGTKRFLKIVSERTHSIGVRGEYTASVLNVLGIKNVTLTGCPSLYMNLSPNLKVRKRNLSSGPLKVALNGSANVIRHSLAPEAAANVERQILETAVNYGYDYVLQNEFPEIDIALGTTGAGDQNNELVSSLKRIGSDIAVGTYRTFLQNHGRVFFDVDQWTDFVNTVDFVVGTRFHGNMIALLSGVPAYLIAHDTRTLEMARLMKIPHKQVDQIQELNIYRLYGDLDYEDCINNYRTLYYKYIDFLNDNGVAHNLVPFEGMRKNST